MQLSTFLGTDIHTSLSGGFQSIVFEAVDDDGNRCVAKLRDSQNANARILAHQMTAVADLSAIDPRVSAPLSRFGGYVSEVQLGERTMLGTLFEFVDGEDVDHSRASDAHLMGMELATLHDGLDRLPRYDIPLLPALSMMNFGLTGKLQLLHGDFSDQNLRNQGGRLRIFDFDDCGYGPRAFDVANSLYMVLFAEIVDDSDGYQQFEDEFLAGYRSGSGRNSFDSADLPRFVDLRVSASQAWLDDLASAPVGIRTSTPEWQTTLRRFIERYEHRRT